MPPLGPETHPRIRQVTESYRRHGFRVALTALSSLDAQLLGNWVQPDFLHLPANGWNDPHARRTAERLRRLGVTTVATHVESEAQWQLVRTAGAALMQGNGLAHPASLCSGAQTHHYSSWK